MSFNFKKTAAAGAAIILAASMCGCADTGYIGTVNGVKYRTGVYLSALLTAAGTAQTEVSEVRKEAGDTSEISDIFVETIDGKNAIDWIKEEALASLKRSAAADKLFADNGLELSADEIKGINDEINSMWNDENFYAQYIYGVDTMGEYYDSIGIGKESLRDIYTNNAKQENLFMHFYDTDGEKAVSEDEINKQLTDTRACVKYIELPFEDKYGIDLKEEAEIQSVKDKAADYASRLNSGTDFIEIQYEHDLAAAQNEAAVKAENEYAELSETEGAEVPADYDKYIQDAIDAATATKHESADELDVVISKSGSSLSEELTDFIWSISADGKAVTFETDSAAYVVVREDITAKTSWKEQNRTSILHEIKQDEFKEILDSEGNGLEVSLDSYLVDTKYAPNKIKGIE
ncbi:MAG: hypothetical protein ACI4KM_10235 [Oscillospiraceae bacterium]